MSFHVSLVGKPEAIITELDKPNLSYDGNPQYELAKSVMKTEIAELAKAWQQAGESMRPYHFSGVKVEAVGHHDNTQRNLRIEINPVRLVE